MYNQDLQVKKVKATHQQAVIYSKPSCIFCIDAKTLLESRGISYEEIDLTGNVDLQQKLQKETNQFTVPYIFIDKKFIGGCQDLRKLLDAQDAEAFTGKEDAE